MKKSKVVVIITSIFVAIIVMLVLKSISTIEKLGQSLLKIELINDWSSNRNNPVDGIVNIGDGLYRILRNHDVAISEINVEGKLGDCLHRSFKVTHSIIIKSPNSTLFIRLRYDPFESKYHIVGYTGSIK